MDTGTSSREKRTSGPPTIARVREVEDHELFGQRVVMRSPSPKPDLRRHTMTMEASRSKQPKKRLRSPSFAERRHSHDASPLGNRDWSKRKHAIRTCSREIEGPDQMLSERQHSDKTRFTKTLVEDSRRGCTPSLRTYDEINACFRSMGQTSKLDGVPRLSSLSLSIAKTYASRGKILDLSDLADSQVHEVLGHKELGAPVLTKLEKLNPSRINVLEASWARLVLNEFGENQLPPRIDWWRTFYEMKKRDKQISLEKARARLKQRYNDADACRNKRHMETTKVLAVARRKKTRSPAASMSRIAQLREEMRRQKRNR